ncbi:MAG: hypothetical protein R3F21_05285 [Myxococcota bacterium]
MDSWIGGPERAARRRLAGIVLLCAFAFALASERAAAQPAQVCLDDPPAPECESQAFTAQVTTVSDPGALFGLLAVGETISGTITLNTAAEDIDLSNANGNYPNGLECATVRFPNGRAMTIRLDPQEPTAERFILVENDVEQPFGGGLSLFSDNVAATTAGAGDITGGDVPPGFEIDGLGGLGYGYSDACISGIPPGPCPPELVTDDSIPGPPGDVAALPGAQLHFQFQSVLQPSTGVVFSDLLSLEARAPVSCPEPGPAASLVAGIIGVAILRSPFRRGRPAPRPD